MSINFWIVLLEWYEFSVYNSLIPYNLFGGKTDFVYYGFALSALSFLARPLGAIYFGGISDKTYGLRLGLLLMSISTSLMALCPNIEFLKSIWFGLCKVVHGFAIGGSYGMAYLPTYNEEEEKRKPRTNYKLAIIQTGWVYGMLIGEFTVLLLKMLVGNFKNTLNILTKSHFDYKMLSVMKPAPAFSNWGWRLAFGISAISAIALYIRTNKIKSNKQPVDNISIKIINYIKRNPYSFLGIFAVISIDMVLFHSWFTYYEVAQEVEIGNISLSILSNLRKLLLIILFPVFGYVTDKLNGIFGRNRGNTIMLILTCLMIIIFSLVKVSTWSWICISSVTAAMCYGSLVAWAIKKFGKNAEFMTGPTFNLSGAIIGGTIPVISTLLSGRFGPQSVAWLGIGMISIPLAILGNSLLRK